MRAPFVCMILALYIPLLLAADGNLEQLIKCMDHDDFTQRESAQLALLKRGAAVVAPLKKALDEKRSEDFKKRAADVIDFFESGGQLQDGLKIKLSSDQKRFKLADGVKLTVTLYNTSEDELNVHLGYVVRGKLDEKFQYSLCRVLSVVQEDESIREVEQGARPLPDFGGLELTPPVFVTLKPYSKAAFDIAFKATLGSNPLPEKLELPIYLSSENASLTVPKGKFRLRSVFTVQNVSPKDEDATCRRPDGSAGSRSARSWQGEVRSNDLVLEADL